MKLNFRFVVQTGLALRVRFNFRVKNGNRLVSRLASETGLG